MSTTATLNQHFCIKSILINPSPLIVKIWQLFFVHTIHSLFRIQYYFIFNSHHTNLTFTFLIQTEVLFLDESGYVKDDDDEDSMMMMMITLTQWWRWQWWQIMLNVNLLLDGIRGAKWILLLFLLVFMYIFLLFWYFVNVHYYYTSQSASHTDFVLLQLAFFCLCIFLWYRSSSSRRGRGIQKGTKCVLFPVVEFRL